MGGNASTPRPILPARQPQQGAFSPSFEARRGACSRLRAGTGGRIDGVGSLPYKPRDFDAATPTIRGGWAKGRGPRRRPSNHRRYPAASGEPPREADLSTEQAGTQAPPRLPRPHGEHRRPQGARQAPRPRSQAAQCLIPAAPRSFRCSGCGNGPISWPPPPAARCRLPRSCCRRVGERTVVRYASASPCRRRLEMRSSAIACGAVSGKSSGRRRRVACAPAMTMC